MSITHINITAPSKAYKQATLSPVHRLSELTFGSLLAAYSLGFVGAIAAHQSELFTYGIKSAMLLSTQYASISIAFAYLTTSFYLTYQAGILTMPQMPLDRLGIDFFLAIAQAVFFGCSILRPWLFPLMMGTTLLLTGIRQAMEHKALARKLYNLICGIDVRDDTAHVARFNRELKKFLKDFPALSGWAPTGRKIWISAATAVTVGVIIGYFVVGFLPQGWPLRSGWQLRTNPLRTQMLITSEVFLATLLIAWKGQTVVKQRATFRIPDNESIVDYIFEFAHMMRDPAYKPPTKRDLEIDVQFTQLQDRLEKLCAK